MVWMLLWLWGCGPNLVCGEGTQEVNGVCVADACPTCPTCPVCKVCPRCQRCPDKPPPEPEVLPTYDGKTAAQFNFSKNGQTIEVEAGTFFEIDLGAPAHAKPEHTYTWVEPITRGQPRFVQMEVGKPDGNAIHYKFVFFVKKPGKGQIRINRKYNAATADPAPDFGVRVVIK